MLSHSEQVQSKQRIGTTGVSMADAREVAAPDKLGQTER
jgi:hypothetical protein